MEAITIKRALIIYFFMYIFFFQRAKLLKKIELNARKLKNIA